MERFVGVLLLTLMLPACMAQPPARKNAGEDFQGFWNGFRAAVLANDQQKVAALTQFPFKTRGVMDGDPVVSHESAGFLILWDKLLTQDPGLKPEPETMRQFIQRKTRIAATDLGRTGSTARIASFVFQKVNDRWLFTMAYVEE
jgi:hypothetical protein